MGTLYTTTYATAPGAAVRIVKTEDNHFVCTYNGTGVYSGQTAFSVYCDGNTIVVSDVLLFLSGGNPVMQDTCALSSTKALTIVEKSNNNYGVIYPITIS